LYTPISAYPEYRRYTRNASGNKPVRGKLQRGKGSFCTQTKNILSYVGAGCAGYLWIFGRLFSRWLSLHDKDLDDNFGTGLAVTVFRIGIIAVIIHIVQSFGAEFENPEENMKVRDIMSQPAIVIHESETLEKAAQTMLLRERRGLPVVNDEKKICGFISVSDYLAKERTFPFSRFKAAQLFGQWVPDAGIEEIYTAAQSLLVRNIMSTPAFTVKEDDTVEQLVNLMVQCGLSRLPVIRDDFPVGMVSRLDLLKMMVRKPAVSEQNQPEKRSK
jgi:CBS domain-containing protein